MKNNKQQTFIINYKLLMMIAYTYGKRHAILKYEKHKSKNKD